MSNIQPPPSGGKPLASPPPSSVPEGPDVEAVFPAPSPQVALRCDGAVLLSIEEMGDVDLTGYSIWTAIVLPPGEEAFARERAANTAQETAAKIIGRLRKKPTS